MMPAVAGGLLALAAICAGLMGYAIQRGATCTVAAVSEVVEQRSARRLLALLEAALWVSGGLAVALALGLLPALPKGYPLSLWTLAGGVLLGLGAYVNGACVFGAVARLGSGDWAYLLTPPGFYLGLALLTRVPALELPHPLATPLPGPAWIRFAAAAFAVYVLWRLAHALARKPATGSRWHRVWLPHEATIVIGVTFVVLLVAVGAWTYTDVLFDYARHLMRDAAWRAALLGALFAGATLGGLTAGRFKLRLWHWRAPLRCLAGGMLMGAGSWLIPGGNDWLLLVGMPLLWPYAWAAVAAMCATIYAALLIERGLLAQRG